MADNQFAADTFLTDFIAALNASSDNETKRFGEITNQIVQVRNHRGANMVVIAGVKYSSKLYWIQQKDFEKSTIKEIKDWAAKIGVTDSVISEDGELIGIPVGKDYETSKDLCNINSWPLYANIIKNNIIGSSNPNFLGYVSDQKVEISGDESIVRGVTRVDKSNLINTIIVISDTGEYVCAGFMPNGEILPSNDTHFASTTPIERVCELISDDLLFLNKNLGLKDLHQAFYVLNSDDARLQTKSKEQDKKAGLQISSKRRKKRNKRIFLAALVVITFVGGAALYQNYISAQAKSQQRQEELERVAQMRALQAQRIASQKDAALKLIENSGRTYTPAPVVLKVVKTQLSLPVYFTDGKPNDRWTLGSTTCLKSQATPEQINYSCSIVYNGGTLASAEYFESQLGLLPEYVSIFDITGIGDNRKAVLSYSITAPARAFDATYRITEDEFTALLDDIRDQTRQRGISFITQDLGRVSVTNEQLQGLNHLREEGMKVAPIYSKEFTAQGAISSVGGGGLGLPSNTMLTKIVSSGNSIQITGEIKYEAGI